jgi:hypothetical protein
MPPIKTWTSPAGRQPRIANWNGCARARQIRQFRTMIARA